MFGTAPKIIATVGTCQITLRDAAARRCARLQVRCPVRRYVAAQHACILLRHGEEILDNTARGGEALPCPISREITELSLAAAQAVGGGILAVDLLETADGRLLVNEVNHTPEFHGAMQAVDADIAGKMVDYVLRTVDW